MNESFMEILINYKSEIKRIINLSKNEQWNIQKLHEELEKSNKDIDNFVSSYEHMKYTKKQFEYLTLDIINSLSPQQKTINLISSNSFINFNLDEK